MDMTKNILIVQDHASGISHLHEISGHAVQVCDVTLIDHKSRYEIRPQANAHIAIFDFNVLDDDRRQMIQRFCAAHPSMPVLMLLPMGHDSGLTDILKMGVCDVLAKPFSLERLELTVGQLVLVQEMRALIRRLEQLPYGTPRAVPMVGKHPAFLAVLDRVREVAGGEKPVHIAGPPGSGKANVARAIYASSPRAHAPYYEWAVPTSEATIQLEGLMESLKGGVLYVRTIGMLPVAVSQRLPDEAMLRGVRLIYSGAPPQEMSTHGHERIVLPGLDERRGDMAMLSNHFIAQHCARLGKSIAKLSDDALDALRFTRWPGNLSQLSALIERCCLLAHQDVIDAGTLRLVQHLEPDFLHAQRQAVLDYPSCVDTQGRVKPLRNIEDEVIRFALKNAGGCMTKAARHLGIGRSTLYRRVTAADDGQSALPNQTTRPRMRISSSDLS